MNRPHSIRVAFQGERGAFSEDAVRQLFPEIQNLVPCSNFEALFAAIGIGSGLADYALAPMENTLAGSVHRCYDLLLESDLHIVAETVVQIRHCLIGCEGSSLETVRTVESHPVALAQCKRFFAEHPHIRSVAAEDTAGSVRHVMETADPMLAAIAGANAAKIYGARILARNLEDHAENYTRFALLASEPVDFADSAESDKISLALTLKNRPGALSQALAPITRAGIDLVKIETRPIAGRPWEYRFFLDLAASARDAKVKLALQELESSAAVEEFRILGCYRSAKNQNINFQTHSNKEFAKQ
jgi:prephenate dehydratase